MRNKSITFASIILIAAQSYAKTEFSVVGEPSNPQTANISFTENKGQVHDQYARPRYDILYSTMTGNLAVHISKSGVSYQLYRGDKFENEVDLRTGDTLRRTTEQTIYRVDMNWLGCNKGVTASGEDAFAGYSNFYNEGCPTGVKDVRSFRRVVLKHLYNGIDLHYYEKRQALKHDYIVSPGADYRQIRVLVQGATVQLNNDGSLSLYTPLGVVQEGAPVVWQGNKQLRARWVVEGDVLSFSIDGVNPNCELLIDPMTRLWGTYYGGSGTDIATFCLKEGNFIYLTGSTSSSQQIATVGAHKTTVSGSGGDAFLVKFSSNGVRQWATYYGGTSLDESFGCAVDGNENVFMTGRTFSSNSGVIATSGAHQTVYNGSDAFLVKFNSNGVRLWGTYYGGPVNDIAYSCATDLNGNVFIAGYTNSYQGFISTPGSHQPVNGGGTHTDGFLVKFNGNGARLWGTYYGGDQTDYCNSCATDASGNVYLCGTAGSYASTVIATPGSHQPVSGGSDDAFLVKFNGNGVRQWATNYGGPYSEVGNSCVVDATGNIFMCGTSNTQTGTAVATPGSYMDTYGGGGDGFLVKFNASGVRQWGTYFGSTGSDVARHCTTDGGGNVFIVGYTNSSVTAIATPGSHQTVYGGGLYDGFLAGFDANGNGLWSSYYGGAGDDRALACAADITGRVYIAGQSNSDIGTIIATPGSHQPGYGGYLNDGFLACFDACLALAQPAVINPSVVCGGGTSTFSVPLVNGASSYTWSLPTGWSGTSNTNILSATPGTSGVFTVLAGNSCSSSPQLTVNILADAIPTITVNSGAVCKGQSFTLQASGANSYTYSNGQVVTPQVTTTYSVTGASQAGCKSTNTANVAVFALPEITITANRVLICAEETVTLTATGAVTYTFDPGGTGSPFTVTLATTTEFSVTGTDQNGCSYMAVQTISVSECTGMESLPGITPAIEVFPSPVSEQLSLQLQISSQVTLVNAVGKTVYHNRLDAGLHIIDMTAFAKGMYLLMVEEKQLRIFKVIKK